MAFAIISSNKDYTLPGDQLSMFSAQCIASRMKKKKTHTHKQHNNNSHQANKIERRRKKCTTTGYTEKTPKRKPNVTAKAFKCIHVCELVVGYTNSKQYHLSPKC